MTFSLSILMAIFPGEPGLASFIEAKDDRSVFVLFVWCLMALSAQTGYIVPY